MASGFEISRRHLEAAMTEAETAGVDAAAMRTALLSTVIEMALAQQSQDEIRQQVSFIIDNSDPDTDFPFMRP